jgi:hypothetical protein
LTRFKEAMSFRQVNIPFVEERDSGVGHVVPDDLAERLPGMLEHGRRMC